MSLSKATGFKPAKATSARAPVARAVSCSAQKQEASKQVATGVAAAALALTFGFGAVDAAYADVAGLTPCSESKAFAKRKKNEVRGGKCAWCNRSGQRLQQAGLQQPPEPPCTLELGGGCLPRGWPPSKR